MGNKMLRYVIYHIKIQILVLFDRCPKNGGRGDQMLMDLAENGFVSSQNVIDYCIWLNEQSDPKTFAQNETPQFIYIYKTNCLWAFSALVKTIVPRRQHHRSNVGSNVNMRSVLAI